MIFIAFKKYWRLIMSNYNYNSTMSIGTAYTPGTTNKYITIQNASVDGFLVAPVATFDLNMGYADTIVTDEILESCSYIIHGDPVVAADNSYVTFDITAQVVYPNKNDTADELVYTEDFIIQINTPEPDGMTSFQVSNDFVPLVSTFKQDSTNPTEIVDGIIKFKMNLSFKTFNIPASGNATVRVPLALE
jgi:hypothetical protein